MTASLAANLASSAFELQGNCADNTWACRNYFVPLATAISLRKELHATAVVKEAKAHPGTPNQSVQIEPDRLLESISFALAEVLWGRHIPRPAQASGNLVANAALEQLFLSTTRSICCIAGMAEIQTTSAPRLENINTGVDQ